MTKENNRNANRKGKPQENPGETIGKQKKTMQKTRKTETTQNNTTGKNK